VPARGRTGDANGHLSDLADLHWWPPALVVLSAAISAEIARGKAAGVHVEKSEHALTGASGGLVQITRIES
jgi:hypothetical protein